jgi:hypothetical protein
MIDFEEALAAPAEVFDRPEAVLEADGLTQEQKVQVLTQWSHDLRELLVATDENMPRLDGGDRAPEAVSEVLSKVEGVLSKLGAEARPAPTRQG